MILYFKSKTIYIFDIYQNKGIRRIPFWLFARVTNITLHSWLNFNLKFVFFGLPLLVIKTIFFTELSSCSDGRVWNYLYKLNEWLLPSTGQLSIVTFLFLDKSCILELVISLDLFLFIALLWSVIHETRIIANHCNVTHKSRRMTHTLHFFLFVRGLIQK